jgi:aminomethyltransferase
MSDQDLLKTPLYHLHLNAEAKMVPFAGYEMPVQYPMGVMKEHLHTREAAGLFDVSHMGQAYLTGIGDNDVAKALEALVPGNITGLSEGRTRYTLFLNDDGGIMDDLMVTRRVDKENSLYVVVNAACKDQDFAHLGKKLEGVAELEILDRALVALQGPKAAEVFARMAPAAADMAFMSSAPMTVDGYDVIVTRCGYTGEDGYEISIANDEADDFCLRLIAHEEVELIGLGARDSLRLECGLCLYGHDLDQTVSPVEGNLNFTLGKARRAAKDFPGADRVMDEYENGPSRLRVGILPDGRAPAREGAEIVDGDGAVIGVVTSGGFGPTLGGPVAMGYVSKEFTRSGTEVGLVVRGKTLPAKVADMPFVEQRYYRKPK